VNRLTSLASKRPCLSFWVRLQRFQAVSTQTKTNRSPLRLRGLVASTIAFFAILAGPAEAANDGQLALTVVDRASGKPIACRMHLKNAAGRPRVPKKVPALDDHFVIPGQIVLKLPTGNYTFEIERGPEYKIVTGHFTIANFADDAKQVELERGVDLAAEGWWSGDLDVHRPVKDIELLMQSEDLHVTPLLTLGNDPGAGSAASLPKELLARWPEDRLCHFLGAQQVRPGGTLSYFNLSTPLKLGPSNSDYPPILQVLERVRAQPGTWVEASKPFWWDVPMLVALGQLDSIQVAHSHFGRTKSIAHEANGKPRDVKRFPGAFGNALWSQEIYFHLLNCGLRIPPTAGSGSGLTSNPVGYNRVYVHVEGDLTYEKWWEGLRAGRVMVTNGPLLRPTVRGELPGHTFHIEKGKTEEFELGLTLSIREPVRYLEIIKNGHVVDEIRFEDYRQTGKLPKIRFDSSGWFLLRVVSEESKTYRFGMTGPYFVEAGYGPRISKASAQFFLDWVMERARQIQIEDPQQRREVLELHRKARDFWQNLVQKANAE
jgi:hypothetical protein